MLYNSTISDGVGQLSSVNETVVENSADQYILGTNTNLDLQGIPGAIVIDNTSLAVQTLTLQPGPEGMDNYMDEWFPFWSPPEGNDLEMDCNYDPVPASSKRSSIIMQFNLTLVPAGATIKDATLLLYEMGGKAAAISYTIHAVNKSWAEVGVSWMTRDLTRNWDASGGDYSTEVFSSGFIDGVNEWKHFDLTRLVDLWTRGAIPNYGFVIVAVPEELDGLKTFYDCETTNRPDQRPMLVVNYTLEEVTGVYESRALGSGTNATFTFASWGEGYISKATEEFDTSNISSGWNWTNDPSMSGGSVNFDRPGWLNITGSQSTNLTNASSSGCNYLHQTVEGDFQAEASLQGYFSENGMGAGLLMKNDDLAWLAIYKTGVPGNDLIVAKACNGTVNTLVSMTWASSAAFLRIDRTSNTYQLLASTDGATWNQVASYAPKYDFTSRVSIGLCVFSGGALSNPIAEFDFLRILPDGQTTELEMRVRTGNSTLLTDPSWGLWGSPIDPSAGAAIGATGKYVQYQVTMATRWEWLSPLFIGFTCYEERFHDYGIMTTAEVDPVDLQIWQTMEVTQSTENGTVEYFYSTDHGGSWSTLGFGTSFPLMLTTPSLTIRAVLRTYDTLTSPTIDTIELVYAVSVSWFYISAPATVTAGVPFLISIQARDPSDNIATSWSGDVALHALDAAGSSSSSSEVHRTMATLTAGEGTFSDQQYDTAEIIRISVNAGGAWGLSDPITVQPGSVASIIMEPGDNTMLEHTSLAFTAAAFDSVGNVIPAAQFAWTAQESLGVLNSATGSTVLLTVGEYDTGGYLSISSAGVTASRMIQVLPSRLAPAFDAALPDQLRPEDYGEWTLDITNYVSDAEDLDSMLRWYATNESVIDVRGENRTGSLIITFSTLEDVFGINILNLFVVDSDGMRTSAPLRVEIESVNDAPTIGHIEPIVVHYDIAYTFDFTYYIRDHDDIPEDLDLSVDDASSPYTTVSGFLARFNFPQSMMGTNHTVIVIVTDPGLLSATAQVLIRITDDFVPSQLDVLPALVLNQGETLANCVFLSDYFNDPEGDVLYYASGYAHVSIEIKPDHYVNVSAPNDWYGIEYVIIQATDPDGARAEGILQVTVLPVDLPPTIANVPDLMVLHDDRYEFDIYPYVYDPDDPVEELILSANDPHCTFMGSVMVVLYPMAFINTVNIVVITVTEENVSVSCQINITVSDNSPPQVRSGYPLPDHSFQEDLPMQYPITQGLDYYFSDQEDTQMAEFEAFTLSPDVIASAVKTESNVWKVGFTTSPNYFGTCDLVLRAIDSEGAIVEEMVTLEIVPIADAPSIDLPDSFIVIEGQQMIFNIEQFVTDPDSFFESGDFTFEFRMVSALANMQDYTVCMNLLPGALVLQYPTGFTNGHVSEIVIEVSVTDQSAKVARDELRIVIDEAPNIGHENPWLWLAVAVAIAGGASGMIGVAWVRRKEPFVVQDLMLIHNDGFLISRYAHHHEGEIDENILSGMLTAVLGFVEDSMSSQHDDLKTFGFRDYRVAVERGEKCFAAVVYEGDAPENLGDSLGEFLDTVERIYKKKLLLWSGDIDTDFAGMEVLMGSWVKEHSKKGRNGAAAVWKTSEVKKKLKVRPKKVQVDMISCKQTDQDSSTVDEKRL